MSKAELIGTLGVAGTVGGTVGGSYKSIVWGLVWAAIGAAVSLLAIWVHSRRSAAIVAAGAQQEEQRITDSKRELREASVLQNPEGSVPDLVACHGAKPSKWGDWSPQTLELWEAPQNFTEIMTHICVPEVSDAEAADAARLPEAPEHARENARRGAGLELTDASGVLFLRCWIYSTGQWITHCPSAYPKGGERPAPQGPAGSIPGGQWHEVRLSRRSDCTRFEIDGTLLTDELPPWPWQSRLRFRITSPNVQPKAWFSFPEAWSDESAAED